MPRASVEVDGVGFVGKLAIGMKDAREGRCDLDLRGVASDLYARDVEAREVLIGVREEGGAVPGT